LSLRSSCFPRSDFCGYTFFPFSRFFPPTEDFLFRRLSVQNVASLRF
jgi:hypothetical protein